MMDFLLAMTIGLLGFLFIHTMDEALEFPDQSAAIFQDSAMATCSHTAGGMAGREGRLNSWPDLCLKDGLLSNLDCTVRGDRFPHFFDSNRLADYELPGCGQQTPVAFVRSGIRSRSVA
ncbi:hypothetical protein GGQ64_005126 [Rhizobium azooxidifex]|uniref:Uncharacterized protein n=1 Tax=Mycoplana azooxidifex TaxID=1636188 RepID=A0A7W6GND9_9HYPH|nr:hypothetical protein [Mycoplana azooxidifex]MBB3979879.1 hypothetical protein [Mycoplana azooxidifex]